MYLVRKEDNNGMALAGTTSWGEVWSVIETEMGDASATDALYAGFFVDEKTATNIANALRRIADLETKAAVMEHEAAGYMHDLYISGERIKELEALIARMDEIANNDSYAEKLSAVAAGVDNSIWLLDDEDDPETITESWHLDPCPKCGQPVSGEAFWDKDTGTVYHPACLGIKLPEPEPIVWCSCKPEKIDTGTCPDCGGEMSPF